MSAQPPCRCLLAEVDPDLAAVVGETVALLPPGEKAGEDVRLSRLALCRACDRLRNGTCSLCGCYVEVRAAKRALRCPAVPPRWREQPPE